MAALEPVIIGESPMLTVLYGDVNSTLAAALVAVKLDTSIAHVEAGLRSFDMDMPEEVNRRLTDQMSDLLFVTSPEGMVHLGDESISWERTYFTGNPMIDTLRQAEPKLEPSEVQSGLSIGSSYAVVTVHRPANVDNPSTAGRLVSALHKLGGLLPVIIPLHPRGRAKLRDAGLHETSSIRVVEPMGYLDFMALVKGAAIVVTDSGGIQEETTALGVPCLTVRTTTERPITVTHGTNQLVVIENLESKASNVLAARKGGVVEADSLPPLWDGRAGRRIASVIEKWARS
jgi:UDP-N-acetylglucosamine 2-epimerase (non-hydrolysing)